MITGHLAAGSLIARATHVFPQFDGASGFVLLSGLVLGIVQSRSVHRVQLRRIQCATLARVALIYLAQSAIVLLGLALLLLGTRTHANVPPTEGRGLAELTFSAITMSLAPPAGSVLRLYVVFLLLAMGAYWLLKRGRWVEVLAASGAVYGLGIACREYTSFVAFDGETRGANWAMWQLLFISALVLGWHWERLGADHFLRRWRWALLVAYLPVGGVVLLAGRLAPELFDKIDVTVLRIAVAYATLAFLYAAVEIVLPVTPRAVVRPIELIGQRSLDSYIIQASVAVIVPSFIVLHPHSPASQLLAVVTVVACWEWARWRVRRSTSGREAAPQPG
ncbi:hypothetical protein GY21_01405 [Cryobacterium roopkundense]|nr:hypothetical protein GY21_01405 [Cryobacterium roopkundense]